LHQQNRPDLAAPELAEAEIISQFLPEMLIRGELLKKHVVSAIEKLGADKYERYGESDGCC